MHTLLSPTSRSELAFTSSSPEASSLSLLIQVWFPTFVCDGCVLCCRLARVSAFFSFSFVVVPLLLYFSSLFCFFWHHDATVGAFLEGTKKEAWHLSNIARGVSVVIRVVDGDFPDGVPGEVIGDGGVSKSCWGVCQDREGGGQLNPTYNRWSCRFDVLSSIKALKRWMIPSLHRTRPERLPETGP